MKISFIILKDRLDERIKAILCNVLHALLFSWAQFVILMDRNSTQVQKIEILIFNNFSKLNDFKLILIMQ